MNFNKRKNLLDGLLDYLCKLADEALVEEVKEEVVEEEVKQEDDKYEMAEGGFVFVKEDGTVYFEDETKTVEAGEIELVDNKIMVIGEDGKLVEIKDKEVVEEELPVEAPVELEGETVEEVVEEVKEEVKEEETVEITIDGKTFNVPAEVAESIKGMVEKNEEEAGKMKEEIEELSAKVQKLEKMVPSVSPVGIEINQSECGENKKKRVYTLQDFVND